MSPQLEDPGLLVACVSVLMLCPGLAVGVEGGEVHPQMGQVLIQVLASLTDGLQALLTQFSCSRWRGVSFGVVCHFGIPSRI